MEVIVTIVRLIYHDVSCIRLELEVADAVLLYVSHHIGEHTLDEVGTDTSRIVFLATQPLGYVPDKVPQVKGGKGGLQSDGYGYMLPVISPLSDCITDFFQFLIIIDIW